MTFYERINVASSWEDVHSLTGLGRIMTGRKVDEILLPYEDGVPLKPSVRMGDKIITAIELMVGNNMRQMAVVRNQRPVGMIRLEDAFKKMGLTNIEEQAGRPL